MCLHGEVSSGVPIVGGASFLIRVRAEPTRNTNNAAQPSRKSSHPHPHNRTDVHTQPRPRRELRVCELSRDRGMGLIPKRTTLYVVVNRSARRSLGVDGLDLYLEGQMIWKPLMS